LRKEIKDEKSRIKRVIKFIILKYKKLGDKRVDEGIRKIERVS
jgi:hypothetical protein